MINYIYCHISTDIPDHLLDSIKSIKSADPMSLVTLITDQLIEIHGVKILQVDTISSDQTKRSMTMDLFRDDPNQLWRTSIFRVFLVRDAMKHLDLDFCYHFDSDVLMFQSSKTFEHLIDDFDGLYMTYHTEDEMVFGFSRFGNVDKIDQICDILHEVIFDRQKQQEYSVGMANEMQLLGGIYKRRPDLIKRLNILPNENTIVFDPSSYGQYFGGTHKGHPPGFSHHTHIIGREIQSGKLVPIMKDKKPYAIFQGKEYPIVNLHIHSKNTKGFL